MKISKKRFLKEIIIAVISFIVTLLFFEMSIVMAMIVFGFFNVILLTSEDDVLLWKKNKKIRCMQGICCLGAVCVVLGSKVLGNDLLTILGAALFATTFSLLLISDLHNHITKSVSDMVSKNKTNY